MKKENPTLQDQVKSLNHPLIEGDFVLRGIDPKNYTMLLFEHVETGDVYMISIKDVKRHRILLDVPFYMKLQFEENELVIAQCDAPIISGKYSAKMVKIIRGKEDNVRMCCCFITEEGFCQDILYYFDVNKFVGVEREIENDITLSFNDEGWIEHAFNRERNIFTTALAHYYTIGKNPSGEVKVEHLFDEMVEINRNISFSANVPLFGQIITNGRLMFKNGSPYLVLVLTNVITNFGNPVKYIPKNSKELIQVIAEAYVAKQKGNAARDSAKNISVKRNKDVKKTTATAEVKEVEVETAPVAVEEVVVTDVNVNIATDNVAVESEKVEDVKVDDSGFDPNAIDADIVPGKKTKKSSSTKREKAPKKAK